MQHCSSVQVTINETKSEIMAFVQSQLWFLTLGASGAGVGGELGDLGEGGRRQLRLFRKCKSSNGTSSGRRQFGGGRSEAAG